jgi:putative transposase
MGKVDGKWVNVPNRKRGFNYSNSGYYFVTICIQDRIKSLGIVQNDVMILSAYGKIADYFWSQIPRFYDDVNIDEYIVMPDHVHGIVVVGDGLGSEDAEQCSAFRCAERCSARTNPSSNYGKLSKVVKSFKEAVVKYIHQNHGDYEFSWQTSFHDVIVRDVVQLNNIRNYIRKNPENY